MAVRNGEDDSEDDDDIISGVKEGFRKHIDALKRACVLDIGHEVYANKQGTAGCGRQSIGDEDFDDDEDDEELLQSLQSKYGCLTHDDSWIPKGLSSRDKQLDFSDEDEDDDAILRSVENLQNSYGSKWSSKVSPAKNNVKVYSPAHANDYSPIHEKDLQHFSPEPAAGEIVLSHPECGEPLDSCQSSYETGNAPPKELGKALNSFLPGNWIDIDQDAELQGASFLPLPGVSYHNIVHLPSETEKSAVQERLQVLADALKKNRECQRTLGTVLSQIEEKQKENLELQKRVRTLVDFERHCSRRFAGFFTDHANPSVQLIATRAQGTQSKLTEAGNKVATETLTWGPPENPDVKIYKELQQNMAFSAISRRWSNDERKDLVKGVKQRVAQQLLELTMFGEAAASDPDGLDEEMMNISRQEFTPQEIRDAVPGIDWAEVARLYVVSRTPEECHTRWINHEDSLINKSPWTKLEDKKLLSIAEENGLCNWEKITMLLGTNRTPAECLTRYQRSLNVSIMRSNWSPEEDSQLRAAVEEYGEKNWSAVSACLEGRNNSQCLMRWYKVLHPTKKRKGRWSVEEDKRLKWAVSVYGPKKWKKIADHVPGRTDLQCRERWCNVLDTSIKLGEWTEEEDRNLEASVARHGPHHWAAVASDIKIRTDNQCCRRWKHLHPEDQLAFQRTVHIRRTALVGNFQGRRKERPKLGPQDFISKASEVSLGITNKTSGKRKSKVKSKAKDVPALTVPENALTFQEDARQRRAERIKKRRVARAAQAVNAVHDSIQRVSLGPDVQITSEIPARAPLTTDPLTLQQVKNTIFCNSGHKKSSAKTRCLYSHSQNNSEDQIQSEVTSFVDLVVSLNSYCRYFSAVAKDENWPTSFRKSPNVNEIAIEGRSLSNSDQTNKNVGIKPREEPLETHSDAKILGSSRLARRADTVDDHFQEQGLSLKSYDMNLESGTCEIILEPGDENDVLLDVNLDAGIMKSKLNSESDKDESHPMGMEIICSKMLGASDSHKQPDYETSVVCDISSESEDGHDSQLVDNVSVENSKSKDIAYCGVDREAEVEYSGSATLQFKTLSEHSSKRRARRKFVLQDLSWKSSNRRNAQLFACENSLDPEEECDAQNSKTTFSCVDGEDGRHNLGRLDTNNSSDVGTENEIGSPSQYHQTNVISSCEQDVSVDNVAVVRKNNHNVNIEQAGDQIDPQHVSSPEMTSLKAREEISSTTKTSLPIHTNSQFSREDEEVACAVRAVLSWPFFHGLQGLLSEGTRYSRSTVSIHNATGTERKRKVDRPVENTTSNGRMRGQQKPPSGKKSRKKFRTPASLPDA